ncbi:MAG TPA: PA0069 family radical SAM protein [Burkholderiales bacterium]|nr:PA0069 family radical SAM protein [Burkholderiales bacterium]
MPLKTVSGDYGRPNKGRGATLNVEGRFEHLSREPFEDGWDVAPEEGPARPETIVTAERVTTIISKNDSPDIPFTLSINPYRGCEHGCIYCYARPSHAYLNLSPGIDFETRLFAKVNAADRLREELSKPGYSCSAITIGANTDPYQPAERDWKITRSILEVASDCNQPVSIITKNAMVERDLDILVSMAEKNLAHVYISVTTLEHELARRMEPRASAPSRRIQAIRRVAEAGVPVSVMVAPVVPLLTDSETEHILEAARDAGALSAGYVLMRLPYEVKELFKDWLMHHYPLKAEHVMSRVKQMRAGRENDPNFGSRMRGSGEFADLLRTRFEKACHRLGLNQQRRTLETGLFRHPRLDGQMDLFARSGG